MDYFQQFLAFKPAAEKINGRTIIQLGSVIPHEQADQLQADFSEMDVKVAIWSIDGSKNPGPDGSGSKFYQQPWSISGDDIYTTILDFFRSGKMLKQIKLLH